LSHRPLNLPSACAVRGVHFRRWVGNGVVLLVWVWLAAMAVNTQAQGVASGRATNHLTAADLGLVINTADPYSVAVGDYYARQRGIPPEQILRVELPVKATLTALEFESFSKQVREHMGSQVQALALSWAQPYAVECNSITAALTLGFAPEICSQTCAPTPLSRYFNSTSARPFSELGLRPSMLIAAKSIASAQALIDRGIASDRQLGKRGAPPVNAVFVNTQDAARNVRVALFPRDGNITARNVQGAATETGVRVVRRDATDTSPLQRVFLYQTGLIRMDSIDTAQWLPGALADHLTSTGGRLLDTQGQMSALDWLEAGATASYGTVTEPCNHLQKFPHPQVLLLHYMSGATALEAYWRSVAWPAQGVFVGEPLAAPFAGAFPR
jgi:uncharacterized protein (TIGR03790 family)